MESPWSTEVVALRAGWTCWPRAADSYRNTKTHLIGWGSLYPGKSLLGVIVFCVQKRLYDSCHFLRETDMVCLKWTATQHTLIVKTDAKLDKMMCFLTGMTRFVFQWVVFPHFRKFNLFIFNTYTHLCLVCKCVLTRSLSPSSELFCFFQVWNKM